jgi:hypothetical protein
MSHSHGRQDARSIRWQQKQREGSHEMNRNRLEHHPQGEHSGQRSDREMENRWENDPSQSYANPRQSNSEPSDYDEYDSRYDLRPRPESWRNPRDNGPANSNREWVSGTGQSPYSQFRSRGQQSGAGSRPSFAGRGPQGYKRSDERITEDINEEMTQDHELDASHISVETKNGEVVLKGTVSDRASKRRAEEIAESCSGVNDVQNQIRIKREDDSDSGLDSSDGRNDDKRSTKLASPRQ